MVRRILGIDPGSLITGSVLILIDGNKIILDQLLLIDNRKIDSLAAKLKNIYIKLDQFIINTQPLEAAVELVFIAKNARSALILGQARGAAITCISMHNIPVFEYSTRLIKQSVVGYGSASKEQVKKMVLTITNYNQELSYDLADAAATAINHYQHTANN